LRVTFWKLEAGWGDWSSGAEVGAMAAAAGSRQTSREDHGDEGGCGPSHEGSSSDRALGVGDEA
jgi:hypothetical protein